MNESEMNFAVKISLAAAGFYLLAGMLIGVVKYRRTMRSEEHRAPVYIDIAHRAAFLYSFAALVIAALLERNSFTDAVLLPATLAVLTFFSLTILGYLLTGYKRRNGKLIQRTEFPDNVVYVCPDRGGNRWIRYYLRRFFDSDVRLIIFACGDGRQLKN